jgi:hypothetical protein
MSFAIKNTKNEKAYNKLNFTLQNAGTTVIERGFPPAYETLLLEDFNTVHHYTHSEDGISEYNIPTALVPNAIYEVYFNCSGGSNTNNDLQFYPVSNNYGGSRFYTQYQHSEDTENRTLVFRSSNWDGLFYVDFFPAFRGYDPFGKITINTDTICKTIQFEMGDSISHTSGKGYWLDDSAESIDYTMESTTAPRYNTYSNWNAVGLLQLGNGYFTNWSIRVIRVG